jgi:hypothetical protein
MDAKRSTKSPKKVAKEGIMPTEKMFFVVEPRAR